MVGVLHLQELKKEIDNDLSPKVVLPFFYTFQTYFYNLVHYFLAHQAHQMPNAVVIHIEQHAEKCIKIFFMHDICT